MPVLDGFEATLRLRKARDLVPIVGLTANVDEVTVSEGLRVGMNEMISKPVHIPTLSACLSRYLH